MKKTELREMVKEAILKEWGTGDDYETASRKIANRIHPNAVIPDDVDAEDLAPNPEEEFEIIPNDSLEEGKGYDLFMESLTYMRENVFPNLSDSELQEFGGSMKNFFKSYELLSENTINEEGAEYRIDGLISQPLMIQFLQLFNEMYENMQESGDEFEVLDVINYLHKEMIQFSFDTKMGPSALWEEEVEEDDRTKDSKKDVIKEELLNFEGDDMYPEIKGDMKRYYKMDVPMDVIKDWADDYFPNRYDDKDDYEFETSSREDFLDHLEDEFASGDSKPEWWNLTEAEEVDVEDNEDIDIDIEDEVEIEAEPTDEGDEILANLSDALDQAKALGDQKLVDQIGNTITFYTRAHIVGDREEVEEDIFEDKERFQKLANI